MPFLRRSALLFFCAAWVFIAPRASAESALELPHPPNLGVIPAYTYDEHGKKVGEALLRADTLKNGNVWLSAESGIEAGAKTVISAELAPVEGKKTLRLISQQSRSFDAAGKAMGVLSVDHVAGMGHCVFPEKGEHQGKSVTMELPEHDRVANVPVNLLFLPLVRGEENHVSFQVMLCRAAGGPRLVDVEASVADRKTNHNGGPSYVEIRYEVDLPKMVRWFAQPFVPRLSFWFNPSMAGDWMAHRMPLYSDGPTVFVVRAGVTPGELNEH